MSADAPSAVRPPKPWEQQLNESSRAYAAFRMYRDMGPQRSIRQVAKAMDRHRTNMEEWSRKHAWVQRVIDYEAEQDRLRRREQRRQLNAMSHRHATMAAAWQDKALKRLKQLDPMDLKPAEALRAFSIAVKIEEKARQIPSRDIIPPPAEIEEELEDLEREVEQTTTHAESEQAAYRADPEDDADEADGWEHDPYADATVVETPADDLASATAAKPKKKAAKKKAKPKAKKKSAKKADPSAEDADAPTMRVIDGGGNGSGPDEA